MEIFAKIFDTKYGQVLAMIQGDENADPEVRIFCQPKGLGVSSMAFGFTDNDEGWKNAREAFDKVDHQMAEKAAENICSFEF